MRDDRLERMNEYATRGELRMDYSAEEIQDALEKFNSLPRGTPGWMEAFELLDSLGLIKMTVNQDAIRARIAEMESRVRNGWNHASVIHV